MNESVTVRKNNWHSLREYTDARIALGRCGVSVPTRECLSFQLDHARAKDAVLDQFCPEAVAESAEALTGTSAIVLESAAKDKREFLMRPDLGRKLSDESKSLMPSIPPDKQYDIAITASDGLSARAIHENFVPFMEEFLPLVGDLEIAPVSVVSRGRVAVADETGSLTGAKVSVILIGERPGLKSPNSMGIYMTFGAVPGTTDERRNCISNVRPEGLSFSSAASKLNYLIRESLRRELSGVDLKDEQITESVLDVTGVAKIAV